MHEFLDDALLELEDAAFAQESRQRIDRIHQATSTTEAERSYREQVFPCEAARMRRDAVERAQEGEAELDLLFVSVGAQPSSPVLAILATPARFVVLVHTVQEAFRAAEVAAMLGLSADRSRCMEVGDGKNPSILYRECFDEWNRRHRPARVGFDLTGGLKTMSAALTAAGFALPGARVFYIDAEQPRIQGQTFWINERRIELSNPFEVFGEIRRAAARDLLCQGHYEPAATAYEDLARQARQLPDHFRAELAKGYHAVERMDFGRAATILDELARELDRRANDALALQDDQVLAGRARVSANAEGARLLERFVQYADKTVDPLHERQALVSDECRDFIAMLLASAERRRREGQMDVAALLAYRASEAVVQRRLALRGDIDPGNLDWDALAARAGVTGEALLDRYRDVVSDKRTATPVERPRKVGRADGFAMLKVAFPDDVARGVEYKKFAGSGEARNRSLLAHGAALLREEVVNNLIKQGKELLDAMLEREGLDQAVRARLDARHRFLEVTGEHVTRQENAA